MSRLLCVLSMSCLLACAGKEAPAASEEPAAVDTGDESKVCEAAPTCGVEGPQCPEGTGCFSLAACGKPVCIATEAACQLVCGKRECAVMESFPMQIGC